MLLIYNENFKLSLKKLDYIISILNISILIYNIEVKLDLT